MLKEKTLKFYRFIMKVLKDDICYKKGNYYMTMWVAPSRQVNQEEIKNIGDTNSMGHVVVFREEREEKIFEDEEK